MRKQWAGSWITPAILITGLGYLLLDRCRTLLQLRLPSEMNEVSPS